LYLNWENRPEDYYCIDIETDDLDATVIWVMCWENIKTKETGECRGHQEIRAFFEARQGAIFVGHNSIKFDAPVINRLLGCKLSIGKSIDTLVLSTLYSPSLNGGHSLAAWGERIGYEKIDFHDWTHLSEEMVTYCYRDVKITAELFRRLTKVLLRIGFSERACFIQHHITAIIARQQKSGFYFDGERAIGFYQQLRQREEELQELIRHAFPAERVLVRERNLYTKSGSTTALYERDKHVYDIELDEARGLYRAFEDVPFNIGSPKQRAEQLTALGWIPDERTPTGQPKLTEKSALAFAEESGIPEVALITKWMSVNGRANMVNTWLENWNERSSCIHGKLFTADTLRFRHQAPNTANIPAVRVSKDGNVLRGEAGFYTYEARDLWCARPGRVLVGTDAAGLELRMLAHYLNREDFTEGVVNGDPHQTNADIVGITRPQAKTLIYAVCYGAGGLKIGRTLKLPILTRVVRGKLMEYSPEGDKIKNMFLERLGLQELIDDCVHEQETGRVWLVDGSGVVCPSPHAALNYKLQGGGARVMAQAQIFLEGHIRRHGLDSFAVGNIHDEFQYDVKPEDAQRHGELAVQSLREAGEELNLNVPLDGTSKIGRTWSETH
jgi:DNA polymerase-1